MNEAWLAVKHRLMAVADLFSVATLLRTLFAPWKNDVQAAANIALGDQVKLWEQNIASRVFGFLIRAAVLVVAAAVIALLSLGLTLYLLGWLLLPFLIILLPIAALVVASQ